MLGIHRFLRGHVAPRVALALLVLLSAAPAAHAVDPNQVIGGSTGKWFSGTLLQQTGMNCSTAILGSAYTEVMVAGIASYGGLPNVPRVGEGYWTSFLVSIPGMPCGTGSSSVNTDVVMPPYTTVDTSRQIRCFGQPHDANTFYEITNETWSFAGQTGRYCPTQATTSAMHAGALSFGFRPLGNGQMFQIFVPVKSTQPLIGAQRNPPDGFRWLTDATGVYANPGLSTVWASVFPVAGGTPAVFFARDPSVVPFWKADAPTTPYDSRNRVELFANVYTAGYAGYLCYEIRRISDNSLRATCTIDPGWNGNVAAGQDTVQILPAPEVKGPNGGYAPLYFDGPDRPDPEWDQDMRITWTFTPTGGTPAPVSLSADFHTLPGQDSDGDGIADVSDSCPSTKGTQADGCMPPVQGDDDQDGAFGATDKCPTIDGQGALDGCPVATSSSESGPAPGALTAPPPATKALAGAIGVRRNTTLKRALLLKKGAPVAVTCSRDSVAALSLVITGKTARKLRIKAKGRQLRIASAKGACTAVGGAKLKLKVARKYGRNVGRAKTAFPATLVLKLTAVTESASAPKVAVKVR